MHKIKVNQNKFTPKKFNTERNKAQKVKIMGKGSNLTEDSTYNLYSWKEIKRNKYWIVIKDKVYNIENFSEKHPGGEQIILNHATQDATVI